MKPHKPPIGRAVIRTTWGDIILESSARGLTRCLLPRQTRLSSRPLKVVDWSIEAEGAVRRHLAGGVNFILRVLEKRPSPALPPLDLSTGTEFQRRVWCALQRIGPGSTKTYSEIAGLIGRSKAVRAVGLACRANPLPLFIPCHRVVPRRGGVGGYSSGSGWKRWLLEQEGYCPAGGSRRRENRRSKAAG